MKLKQLVGILLLLLPLSGVGQHPQANGQRFLYRLSKSEAKSLLQKDSLDIPESYFHTLVDSTTASSFDLDKQAFGHYLSVQAKEESQDVRFRSHLPFEVFLINTPKGLHIQVQDSSGQLIRTAEVQLNDKRVSFSAKSQSYAVKKWTKRSGKLMVEVGGMSARYHLKSKKRYGSRKRPKKKFGIHPVRWAKQLYWRTKYWVQDGAFFRERDKGEIYQGYIAINQPRYRPGDTLLVKCYVTNKKGKPLSRPLQVRLGQKYRRSISPSPKGQYLAEIVLHDSLQLQLDRAHYLSFYDLKKQSHVFSQFFTYADYQLDALTFDLQLQTNFDQKEKRVQLIATTDYANGLSATEGQLDITAYFRRWDRPISTAKIASDRLLLKRELWTHRQSIDFPGPTVIPIPDSIFPLASLPIDIQATFTTADGETHRKSVRLDYQVPSKNEELLELSMEGPFLKGTYTGRDSQRNVPAILHIQHARKSHQHMVTLPFQYPLNGATYRYVLQLTQDSVQVEWMPGQESRPIAQEGLHRGDSLWVRIKNPRMLPFKYELYREQKLLTTGQSQADRFQLRQKAKAGKSYQLYIYYLWGGKPFTSQATYVHYKNKLDISVEQASDIVPGQDVTVKIKVEQEGRPVQGVNLLAAATNAQFQDQLPVRAPDISYESGKSPKKYHPYLKHLLWDFREQQLPMKESSAKRLGVDQELFYQIRFPQKTLHTIYIPAEGPKEVAQFAPYVVSEGQTEAIYLIYCNKKLVYYSETDDQPPYSFIGQPGYNFIELRTRDRHYVLDSVWMSKGQKLELSIRADATDQELETAGITYHERPPELTSYEYAFVKRHLFFLRKKGFGWHTLQQGDHHIRSFQTPIQKKWKRHKDYFCTGPFQDGQVIRYQLHGGFESKFLFESGYGYDIDIQRERLYGIDWPETVELKDHKRVLHPGQFIKNADDLPTSITRDSSIRYDRYTYANISAQTGAYQFKQRPNDSLNLALVLSWQRDSFLVFLPNIRYLSDLSDRSYTLRLIGQDGHYKERTINPQVGHLLYENWEDVPIQRDPSQYWLRRLPKTASQADTIPYGDKAYRLSQARQDLLFPYSAGKRMIYGYVIEAETEEVLIGANVYNRELGLGAATDFEGFYQLELPANVTELTVNYIGMSDTTIQLSEYMDARLDIYLEENSVHLAEYVVVTGYSRARKKEKSEAESANLSDLSRNAFTEDSDGLKATEKQYLYLIDGEKRRASIQLLKKLQAQQLIASLEFLSAKQAQQRQLSEDSLPVILIYTNKSGLPMPPAEPLRNNFRDYAYWQPQLISDKKGEATFQATFPDDLTGWNTYVLGMGPKLKAGMARSKVKAYRQLAAQLSLPRFLIQGDESQIVGKVLNYTEDSLELQTTFKQADNILQNSSQWVQKNLSQYQLIQAEDDKDSLQVSYQVDMGPYMDGESRKIPILRKGVEESTGQFLILRGDTTLELSLDPNLGPIKIHASSSRLDLFTRSLDYLIQYPHGCNEQTASKLMGLIWARQIKRSLGQPFDKDEWIRKGINKLRKAQNDNGLWGWWPGNESDFRMSPHITNALLMAQKAGFATPNLKTALNHIRESLPGMSIDERLRSLQLLSAYDQKVDYRTYIIQLEETLEDPSLQQELSLMHLRGQHKMEWSLDSLLAKKRETAYGGIYWGGEENDWFNNNLETTLLAYSILQGTKQDDLLDGIELYFLRTQKRSFWYNTIATIRLLNVLLPNLLLTQENLLQGPQLTIEADRQLQATQFPFQAKLSSLPKIKLTKKGGGAIFISLTQTYWKEAKNARSKDFEVSSSFWQNGQEVNELIAGQQTQLQVTVRNEQDMEYVMVEVPIPAGCAHAKQAGSRSRYEVYREQFKEKAAIFCRDLPAGEHVFRLPLLPRFAGTYHLNPAKAEEMYFPTLNGREAVKEVRIRPAD
ncbi:MAG: alpha-2-macroglobulin family protein [Bacteroidota bacterium]